MSRASPAAPPPITLTAHPLELALIKHLLRDSKPIRDSGYVHATDFYAAKPADLVRRFAAGGSLVDGECAWYFITPPRPKSPRGEHVSRTVAGGVGWWRSVGGSEPVVEHGDAHPMGHRQTFVYMKKGDRGASHRAGNWLMVELRLDDDQRRPRLGNQLESRVEVVCKLQYQSSGAAVSATAQRAADDENGATTAAAPQDASSSSPAREASAGAATAAAPEDASASSPARKASAGAAAAPEDASAPSPSRNASAGAATAATGEKTAIDQTGPKKRASKDEDASASPSPALNNKAQVTELRCPQCRCVLQVVVAPATAASTPGAAPVDPRPAPGRRDG